MQIQLNKWENIGYSLWPMNGLLILLILIKTPYCYSPQISDALAEQEMPTINKIVKGKPYSTDGYRVTFEKDGFSWTILGANAAKVHLYERVAFWPVKGDDFEVLVVNNPITNQKILPWTTFIEDAFKDRKISIQGCPGEYEPASFIIRSGDKPINNVVLRATDLFHQDAIDTVISNKQIDVRVVKSWFQAGTDLHIPKGPRKTLTPELLLKDDSIVQVDYDHQVNLIKNFSKIQDAPELQLFSIPSRENKQIWLTVHVPPQAKPGTYYGAIEIQADLYLRKSLDIEVEVLPFTLSAPNLYYSIFYDGDLIKEGEPITLARRERTEKRMLQELKDMREHGIINPVVTQFKWDPKTLLRILRLRKEAGFSNKTIFYVTWPGFKKDGDYLHRVEEHANNAVELLKNNGVKEVYFYGFDELKEPDLGRSKPFYQKFREVGARTFVAGEGNFFNSLYPYLDIAIIRGAQPQEKLRQAVKQAHDRGMKAWVYSFPQCGREEPETYRRNFGLLLWKLGFDGSCNYQASMNHPWDDFDHPTFRDEIMTYPTIDGLIPTIQWEGWREGIKDVRYLSTAINLSHKTSNKAARAEFLQWIDNMDVNGDLSQIRKKMIYYILTFLENRN